MQPKIPATSTAQICTRLRCDGVPFTANTNIADALLPGEIDVIEAEVERHIGAMLAALVIDVAADHNTTDTARRVAKMLVHEVFAGRYEPAPTATAFPNVRQVDELYAVGPITVRSACAHHLVPIMGEAWVGVIPADGKLIGLSKFHRLAEWVMARPQIQEEAVQQLADVLAEACGDPIGLGVVVRAEHLCCGWRGVRDRGSRMVSSVLRGALREKPEARAEFYAVIEGMGFR